MDLQKIYDHSPVWGQHLMTSLAGFRNNAERYGRSYWEHREWLRAFDTWTLEEKLEHQRKALVEFIQYAARASNFYAQLYSGLRLDDIESVDDLRRLPTVGKEALRRRMDDVRTITASEAVEGHTGGTTGKSLVVYFTRKDTMHRMAMLDHFKSRVGFEHRKMKRASFSGKHIIAPGQRSKSYWRYNAACKQMIYSPFHLNEQTIESYVTSLNRFKPDSLDGFFSPMVELAEYIERAGVALKFRPRAIFPTSETVTNRGRDALERVFGARVYDQYASSEGAPFITECSEGSLHIELASGVFEPSDEGALVTSFTTHGTPLIRYAIGDDISGIESGNCACGVAGQWVRNLSGRSTDFLWRTDGGKVSSVNFANMFKNVPNALIRAQAVQEVIGVVVILLEVDPSRYDDSHDQLLRAEFEHKFGTGTRLDIRHVHEIAREASGKLPLIKNLVPQGGKDD